MMLSKSLFLFFLGLNLSRASSEVIHSRFVSIDLPDHAHEPALVMIEHQGRVLKLSMDRIVPLMVEWSAFKNAVFQWNVDSNRWIQSMTRSSRVEPVQSTAEGYWLFQAQSPTIFKTRADANIVFQKLNPHYRRRSQCYNRAHVWSYEMFRDEQINSMKVFLFFTRKYIREYDWAWWFHVSPFVYVENPSGSPTEWVMDYRFLDEPSGMRFWTDYFMRSKTECPTVNRYSEYRDHQEDHYCYLIKVPMFYWQPRDLEALEEQGIEKNKYEEWEVQAAYRQGF